MTATNREREGGRKKEGCKRKEERGGSRDKSRGSREVGAERRVTGGRTEGGGSRQEVRDMGAGCEIGYPLSLRLHTSFR